MRKFTLLCASFLMALAASANIGDLPKDPPTSLLLDPVPGATPEVYVKSGIGIMSYVDPDYGERLDVLPSEGSLTKIIRDGDKIYLNRVFSWFDTPGWIEGTVSGNTATFQLPQLIKQTEEDVNGVIVRTNYYAVICDLVVRNGNGDMVPSADQVFTMEFDDLGALYMGDMPGIKDPFICSFTYTDFTWDWSMDGDQYDYLAPLEAKSVAAPDNVTFTPMALTYPHLLYGGKYAQEVEVGFDGDDCYIKGIALGISDLEDAVIKGTRNGKVISFDSNQFLGESWLFGFTQYFIGGETEYVDSEIYGPSPEFSQMNNIEFIYDEEDGSLISDMSFIIVPSPQDDDENLYYENIYVTPELYPIDKDAAITALDAPEVVMYQAPAFGYPHQIDFVASMVSTDNQLLDMSKLYFQILLEGVPFEFTPEMDPALKEATDMIPFASNDYYCFVAFEQIYQMVAIPSSVKFNSMYLRLVYDPYGENPVYSDATFVAGDPSAVEEVAAEEEVEVTYTDLQGRSTLAPTDGIYIRTAKMSDGTFRHSKVLVK